MAAPDFSRGTIETLSARSAHICSNPQCSCITVGPSDGSGTLALKIGEAAHIRGARSKSARYDQSMTDSKRADISNAIWLCSNCHTLIDKNHGADFPVAMLEGWKTAHEATIRALLHSHKSPMSLLRQFTEEAALAQELVDILEGHGALFMPYGCEVPADVISSFARMRSDVSAVSRKIRLDTTLKNIAKDIVDAARAYMNITGTYSQLRSSELQTVRNRVGVCVARLESEYGTTVHGQLHQIVP